MTALEILKDMKGSPHENCKRGHPLNSKNLYEHPKGYVTCRVCMAQASRQYYSRNRQSLVLRKREYYRRKREAA